ncbi:MAG: DinB family protein [Vicinamibacteria bacterium]
MLDPGLTARLAHQLASFRTFAAEADPRDLAWAPPSGQWSALLNLAHVGRHHEVMLERLERVLIEDAPAFPAYRETEDARWAAWEALTPETLWPRLSEVRAALEAWAARLTAAQAARTGVHARFGPMDVARWLEFFLVHEAHHLYVAMQRLADARAART